MVDAEKTQKQKGTRIRVTLNVTAEETLTAKATGEIRASTSCKLKPKTVEVAAGQTMTLKLKPKKRVKARKVADALKHGKKATAKLTVKLRDHAGNTESERLSVRLKR